MYLKLFKEFHINIVNTKIKIKQYIFLGQRIQLVVFNVSNVIIYVRFLHYENSLMWSAVTVFKKQIIFSITPVKQK